jgi:hypothetical protein
MIDKKFSAFNVITKKQGLFLGCVFFLSFNISCSSNAYQDKNKVLSLEEVNQDFKVLTKDIEKDVPHPYYACSPKAYDSVKNMVANSLHDSMSVLELYRAIYPLVQILNDAHFSIHLPDNFEETDILYFPFKVCITNNQLFVKENLSDNKTIKKGDEIISINNVPVKSIIDKIRSCNFKSRSEEDFFERWNEDNFYYKLNSLFGFNYKFSITTRDAKLITVSGINKEQFYGKDTVQDSFYKYEVINATPIKIGYLKISSLIWDKKERRDTLEEFLKGVFYKIKEDSIKDLILDIRNNLGGSSTLAKDILDYITTKPFTFSLGEEYFKNGKLLSEYDSSLYLPRRVANKFLGETVLLTDVLTYSSAHMMAVGFKHYNIGKVVGQVS